MARKTTRRHAQGDASRRTILDATLRIAGERGYVGTTMSRVEKAAGVSASSLYWHFKSKDELLMDALDHGYLIWRQTVQPWTMAPSGSLVDSILLNLRNGAVHFHDEPGFWRMGLLLGLESGPAVQRGPRERFMRIRADALAGIGEWWTTALGATPEIAALLARFTLATLDGLFIRHQAEGPEDLDTILRLLAAGLAQTAERIVQAASLHLYGAPPPEPLVAPHPPASEPESSRMRLLDAAYTVAAESGYQGATISRICAVAGLPASSLYWHFRGKDDLFAAAVDHSYRQWELDQPVWQPPRPGATWQDELRSHMLVTAHSLAHQPRFLRLGYLLLLVGRSDSTTGRETFVGVRARRHVLVQEWLRAVLDVPVPEERTRLVAQLVMVFFDGLFFSARLDDGPWEPVAFADLMLSLLSASLYAEA